MTAWNPVCSYWRSLSLPTVFTLYCSFAANRRMWTLSTSVVPSGWFAGVFLFSVTVSCPFPSRFFDQSLSCATGEHCWTMLTSEVMWTRFGSFRCLTVISVVHMVAQHADTPVAVVESFSFACHATTCFQETFFRKRNLGNANQWNTSFSKPQVLVLWFLGCLV